MNNYTQITESYLQLMLLNQNHFTTIQQLKDTHIYEGLHAQDAQAVAPVPPTFIRQHYMF